MQHIKHAIISAAGFGSRLGLDMPKCLVTIGRKKIIDFQLELLESIPDVRVVVGFQESVVIDYIRKIRPDVTFVRNPDYVSTSNSYSVHLASRWLKDPFLIIDGDLIFGVKSFQRFLKEAEKGESIIGITSAKTEEAVFVKLDQQTNKIIEFYRKPAMPFEWAGLAFLKNITIENNDQYIFEELKRYLPVKAFPIECFEIDTPDDLAKATYHFKELGYSSS